MDITPLTVALVLFVTIVCIIIICMVCKELFENYYAHGNIHYQEERRHLFRSTTSSVMSNGEIEYVYEANSNSPV